MTYPIDFPYTPQYVGDLERDGFALVSGVLTSGFARTVADQLDNAQADASAIASSRRAGSVYALRNVLTIPVVQTVVTSQAVRSLVEDILGPNAFAVRGILFDKTPGANWNVPWHQDIAVPVKERRDTPGWSGWSTKAGVVHAHPPASVLENMVTVRLHLDPCGPENGPLRVLPGTHRHGRLTDAQTETLRSEVPETVCTAGAGDALLMRPLLLHASSASEHPARRRVLHIEWANRPLPSGLEWAEAG